MAPKKPKGTEGAPIKASIPAKPQPAVEKIASVTRGPGQPSKYDPAFCQALIAHMASGLSFESFGGKVGVHRDTLYEWVKTQEEFSDAKKVGLEKGLLRWEQIGLMAASGGVIQPTAENIRFDPKKFNPAVFIFTMKNRFGWRDKIEHSGDEQKPIRVIVEEYGTPNPADAETD